MIELDVEKTVIAVQVVTNLVLLVALMRAGRRAEPAAASATAAGSSRRNASASGTRKRRGSRDVLVPGQVDLELLRMSR